ncbi:MAG: cytidylate kinase family protein [Candidatus Micrarchaeota archaeon]|nr:cytidylate kinase family protein [Candidatus Micrarchaeota archaeon]
MKICISGFAGSGKTTVANKLSEMLKFPVINITFKDLAKAKGVNLEEIQKLAEKDPNIDLELDRLIVEKASQNQNCIISTWLSPWIIKDADLRVFLFAPLETRAKRVAQRDNIDFTKALKHVKRRDSQNIRRYKKLYKIDIRNTEIFDMLINTKDLEVLQVAELIIKWLSLKGKV